MRIGDTVQIVASQPAEGQAGIEKLLGHTRKVLSIEREDGRPTGRITVSEFEDNHSPIVLQAGEYKSLTR